MKIQSTCQTEMALFSNGKLTFHRISAEPFACFPTPEKNCGFLLKKAPGESVKTCGNGLRNAKDIVVDASHVLFVDNCPNECRS